MNEKFFELPKEKQRRIINAGMEVFAQHEYKRAVTDDIAAKAGISKGLLFYYFHNKKSFYLYLNEYCFALMNDLIVDEAFTKIDDFFDLLEYGASQKMTILSEYPHLSAFVMRAYYSQNEVISEDVNEHMQEELNSSYTRYFAHLDFSKFKEDVDPHYIYQMLVWLMDGYLHMLQSNHQPLKMNAVMVEYHKWKTMFKTLVYKEEFL